ncbi:hypothetical protein DFH27DRAFT_576429 [Peziza echinospora]|nr:hypothetical protein DFH27DRAFT_576429 [Peziza echinospora]
MHILMLKGGGIDVEGGGHLLALLKRADFLSRHRSVSITIFALSLSGAVLFGAAFMLCFESFLDNRERQRRSNNAADTERNIGINPYNLGGSTSESGIVTESGLTTLGGSTAATASTSSFQRTISTAVTLGSETETCTETCTDTASTASTRESDLLYSAHKYGMVRREYIVNSPAPPPAPSPPESEMTARRGGSVSPSSNSTRSTPPPPEYRRGSTSTIRLQGPGNGFPSVPYAPSPPPSDTGSSVSFHSLGSALDSVSGESQYELWCTGNRRDEGRGIHPRFRGPNHENSSNANLNYPEASASAMNWPSDDPPNQTNRNRGSISQSQSSSMCPTLGSSTLRNSRASGSEEDADNGKGKNPIPSSQTEDHSHSGLQNSPASSSTASDSTAEYFGYFNGFGFLFKPEECGIETRRSSGIAPESADPEQQPAPHFTDEYIRSLYPYPVSPPTNWDDEDDDEVLSTDEEDGYHRHEHEGDLEECPMGHCVHISGLEGCIHARDYLSPSFLRRYEITFDANGNEIYPPSPLLEQLSRAGSRTQPFENDKEEGKGKEKEKDKAVVDQDNNGNSENSENGRKVPVLASTTSPSTFTSTNRTSSIAESECSKSSRITVITATTTTTEKNTD